MIIFEYAQSAVTPALGEDLKNHKVSEVVQGAPQEYLRKNGEVPGLVLFTMYVVIKSDM